VEAVDWGLSHTHSLPIVRTHTEADRFRFCAFFLSNTKVGSCCRCQDAPKFELSSNRYFYFCAGTCIFVSSPGRENKYICIKYNIETKWDATHRQQQCYHGYDVVFAVCLWDFGPSCWLCFAWWAVIYVNADREINLYLFFLDLLWFLLLFFCFVTEGRDKFCSTGPAWNCDWVDKVGEYRRNYIAYTFLRNLFWIRKLSETEVQFNILIHSRKSLIIK